MYDFTEVENSMIAQGYCFLGDAENECIFCGSYSVTSWGDWRRIKHICMNCGGHRFVSCSQKRTSTRLHNWSLAVRERDGFMCRKCGSREKLNAHHIKSFADFPELRFDINNGITLCEDCHKKEHKKIDAETSSA